MFGTDVDQSTNGSITLKQTEKLNDLGETIFVEKHSTKTWNDGTTQDDLKSFRRAIGKMMSIGHMPHPVLPRIASFMASKPSDPLMHHLKELTSLVRYSKSNTPNIDAHRT